MNALPCYYMKKLLLLMLIMVVLLASGISDTKASIAGIPDDEVATSADERAKAVKEEMSNLEQKDRECLFRRLEG